MVGALLGWPLGLPRVEKSFVGDPAQLTEAICPAHAIFFRVEVEATAIQLFCDGEIPKCRPAPCRRAPGCMHRPPPPGCQRFVPQEPMPRCNRLRRPTNPVRAGYEPDLPTTLPASARRFPRQPSKPA